MSDKVGRNDPCPCGSGKKHKNCCWGKQFVKKKIKASVIRTGSPDLISRTFAKKEEPVAAQEPEVKQE